MIVYRNVMEMLSAAGYSSYRIQREKLIPGSTLNRLRNNEPISTETINTICKLCGCQPGDFLAYVAEKEEE